MSVKVISFGELLWDILPDKTILGGAPANLAYRLSELGTETYLVTRVGKDELGNEAIELLKKMGLPTHFIQLDEDYPTGSVDVQFDSFMNPDYTIIPDVAYDRIELTPELLQLTKTCDCFIFGTLAQRSMHNRETVTKLIKILPGNAVRFLDINLRKKCFTKASVEESLNYATILKANYAEIHDVKEIFNIGENHIPGISEKISERFNIKTILVTLEHNGAYLYDRLEGEHYVPGHRVILKDPLGAGDAFSAGFIHAVFNGKSLKEACDAGNCYGAVVATKKGATEAISKNELEDIVIKNDRIFDQNFNNL